MFHSIVVPLDGSSEAEAAVALARSIAAASGGSMYLLRVNSASDADAEEATVYLGALTQRIRAKHIQAYAAVRSGDPAAEILRYSRSQHADMIVMTTRAVGSRSMLALTSVARHVVSESPAPVLLLRPGDEAPDHIRTLLVPVDGSPGASLALAAARGLSHATHARIIVLQVVTLVPTEAFAALPGATLGGYIDPEWESLALSTAHSYVERLASRLNDCGVEAEGRVATGEVVTELLHCAHEVDADVVVMGTHSVTWPSRAYAGSVADRVLREGERPVLLVRREPPAGDTTNND